MALLLVVQELPLSSPIKQYLHPSCKYPHTQHVSIPLLNKPYYYSTLSITHIPISTENFLITKKIQSLVKSKFLIIKKSKVLTFRCFQLKCSINSPSGLPSSQSPNASRLVAQEMSGKESG